MCEEAPLGRQLPRVANAQSRESGCRGPGMLRLSGSRSLNLSWSASGLVAEPVQTRHRTDEPRDCQPERDDPGDQPGDGHTLVAGLALADAADANDPEHDRDDGEHPVPRNKNGMNPIRTPTMPQTSAVMPSPGR